MTKQNLATVTNELIASYGNTAKNLITAYRVGNTRAVGYLDKSWAAAVRKTGTRLNGDVRGNAIAAQQKLTGYYATGVETTTANAHLVVNKAVALAGKGVVKVAANASRFEKSTGVTALSTLAEATVPAAQAVVKAVAKIEHQSSVLANKMTGTPVKAKATAAKRGVIKKATAATKVANTTKVATRTVRKAVKKAAA